VGIRDLLYCIRDIPLMLVMLRDEIFNNLISPEAVICCDYL
jgi:hypothetical protein